jgi:hypothetical protein
MRQAHQRAVQIMRWHHLAFAHHLVHTRQRPQQAHQRTGRAE